MKRLRTEADSLSLSSIAGTALQCGLSYGEEFSGFIRGFCAQEICPTPQRIKYAKACLPFIRRHAKKSLEFMRGMSIGSKLSLEAITSLTLHEEFYHLNFKPSHCTALVTTPSHTVEHKTVIGQNWDWQPQLIPWPGLLRLSIKDTPTVLAYHYPGLWNCCGINSEGLALMWTGGGYFPPLKPKLGVPTYVIIAELLRMKNVHKALSYLRTTPRAGAFIFLLSDASGDAVIVEATNSKLVHQKVDSIAYRANLYCTPELIRASHQEKPNMRRHHSVLRINAVKKYLAAKKGRICTSDFKRILSLPDVFVDLDFRHRTIDQFIAVCEERSLLVKRGSGGTWMRLGVV